MVWVATTSRQGKISAASRLRRFLDAEMAESRHMVRVRQSTVCLALTVFASALMTGEFARAQDPVPAQLGATQSSTGQFRVFGTIPRARVEMATLAEEVRTDMLRLLREPKMRWSIPIGIEMLPGDDSEGGVRTTIESVAGSGYRIRVFTKPGKAMTERALREATTKALLVELALRRLDIDELKEGELLPEWLWRGVYEAMELKRNPEKVELFRVMIADGEFLSVSDLISKPYAERTPVGQRLYEASSGALVLTLLNQINGPMRFLQMIREAPLFHSDPEQMIKRSFQNIEINAKGLEKWWALQVVQLAEPEVRDVWTPQESSERIRSAMRLIFEIPQSDQAPARMRDILVENLADIEDEKIRRNAIAAARKRLGDLISKVHPAYRDIVEDMVAAYSALLEGKGDALARIASIGSDMDSMTGRLEDISDYLNWTEVLNASNGDNLQMFDSFFDMLRESREKRSERTDEISVYLDGLQKEFE